VLQANGHLGSTLQVVGSIHCKVLLSFTLNNNLVIMAVTRSKNHIISRTNLQGWVGHFMLLLCAEKNSWAKHVAFGFCVCLKGTDFMNEEVN
jgi:hypothetical protein